MVEVMGVIAALVSVLLGSLATRETLRAMRLRSHGVRASGTIVALESYRKRSSILYLPVFEFQTAPGSTVRVTCQQGSSPSPFREGDAISVLYLPNDPAGATIDTFAMLWLAPVLLWLATIGCLMAIAGGFYLAGVQA